MILVSACSKAKPDYDNNTPLNYDSVISSEYFYLPKIVKIVKDRGVIGFGYNWISKV